MKRTTAVWGMLVLLCACKSVEQRTQEAVTKGQGALEAGDLALAVSQFDEALELSSFLPAAQVGKARALHQSGRPKDALDVLGSCSESECLAVEKEIGSAHLEALRAAPFTTESSREFLQLRQRISGEGCGLIQTLADLATVQQQDPTSAGALRSVLAEFAGDANPTANSPEAALRRTADGLDAARASGKRAAGHDPSCEQATSELMRLHGRVAGVREMLGHGAGANDPMAGITQLHRGDQLSTEFWQGYVGERLATMAEGTSAHASGSTTDSPMAIGTSRWSTAR